MAPKQEALRGTQALAAGKAILLASDLEDCSPNGFHHAMKTPLAPATISPPFGRYSHGIAVDGIRRLVVTSGQLAIRPDGTIPETVEGQAALCFEMVGAILAEAGMDFSNVIRINAYLTDRADFPAYMAVRDRFVTSPPPASTLLIVTGFTRPEFKVEVEVTAVEMA